MATVPTNYKIKIKDLLNSSLGKVVIDSITAKSVKVNNILTVDAANVKLDNEKGTTLQDVLNYFEEGKLNRHTDDTFDGNLTIKKDITIEGNIKSNEGLTTVEENLEATGEITDGHSNQLNDVNSAAKNWKIEYQDPTQDEPTVRAKYVLKDYKGVPKGNIIKVYKDSAITNVYLGTTEDTCNPDTGEATKHEVHDNNEALSIVYKLDTGKYMLVNVPLGVFTREAEFDKYRGLGITPNGQVFVKLASDVESTNYLHFNSLGEIAADGIEARILRDLGTLINSIAGDNTMWGQYKRHEGTQETSTSNDGSRWGEFKKAEEIREQTSDSAHTVFSDNWDEQDDDPEDYDPLAVVESTNAYNWKTTDTPASDGKREGNLKDLYQKSIDTNEKVVELDSKVESIYREISGLKSEDVNVGEYFYYEFEKSIYKKVATNNNQKITDNISLWKYNSSVCVFISGVGLIDLNNLSRIVALEDSLNRELYSLTQSDNIPIDEYWYYEETNTIYKKVSGGNEAVKNCYGSIWKYNGTRFLYTEMGLSDLDTISLRISFNEIEKGINSLIKDKSVFSIHDKCILASTGKEYTISGYSCTDFIKINGSKIGILNAKTSGSAVAYIAFYDENKSFLSAINAEYSGDKEVKVPQDAVYVRFTSMTENIENVILIGILSLGSLLQIFSTNASRFNPSKSKNLYNWRECVIGFLRPKNIVEDLPTYRTSNFIRIKKNTDYVISNTQSYGLYDESFVELNYYVGSEVNATLSFNSSNAVYLRISTNAGYYRISQVEEGVEKTDFSPFFYPSISEYEKERTSFNSAYTSLFKGKKYMSLGDSLTARGQYQEELSLLLGGLSEINNKGLSGRCISNWIYERGPKNDGTDDTELISPELIAQYDIITFGGIANDYVSNVVLGSIEDNFESNTFYGYTKRLCEYIITSNPTCMFVGFSVPPFNYKYGWEKPNPNGFTIRDYAKALKDVCSLYSVPFVDMMSMSGICEINSSIFYNDNDTVHPNRKGMRRMADCLASVIIPLQTRAELFK